ncbi:hypothetical protein HZB05_01620 [Candidatus Wolfebacteria bacterium]|nr:hypothetical protein [Candidatus Wolfebacteria bacterium]
MRILIKIPSDVGRENDNASLKIWSDPGSKKAKQFAFLRYPSNPFHKKYPAYLTLDMVGPGGI